MFGFYLNNPNLTVPEEEPPTLRPPNSDSLDLVIAASKEDLIDISRTLALALTVGYAEYQLKNRKIIVKVEK